MPTLPGQRSGNFVKDILKLDLSNFQEVLNLIFNCSEKNAIQL
jgi:hypothetical protein